MDLTVPMAHERKTAHQLVRDALRHAILKGAIPGGTRLVQGDIASQLKVSTTPVREALRDLANEGLIRLDPHRGAIVYEPDLEEVRDLYDVRKILEVEAIRRAAARISEGDLQRAEAIQTQMDAETDSVAWVDLNREFHAVLSDAAGSAQLTALLKKLRDAAALFVALSLKMSYDHLQTGNHEHRRLLEAIHARDGEAAGKILAEHLESTMHAVEQGRLRPPA